MRFARIFAVFCFVFCLSVSAWAANFTVTKTADTNDGMCDADCSLREAVAATAVAGNDNIYFALPLFGSPQTITLSLGEIAFGANGSTTVFGTGANRLTISGNNASRIFVSSANAVVNINHMRLTGGNGAGAANSGRGGAVYNFGGTMTLSSLVVTGNSAANGGALNAAASGATPANTTIINCFFTNNTATSSGAAIQNFSTSTMSIIGTTVANNSTSATGIAGAIQANGTVNITNSTFSGNTAATGTGGGVYFNGSSMTMTNTTIANNSSVTGGGGLHRTGSNPLNIRNTIFSNNAGAGTTPDVAGVVNSQGSNIITIVGTSTGWIGSDLQNMNPMLAPLGFYGGLGYTHALLTTSPAINGGQNCVTDLTCSAANPPVAIPKDQRFALRDGNVDIGSFEASANYAGILPSALFNQSYNQIITPNVGSFTYAHSGGSLPPGISVITGSVVALVNGTPTVVYGFDFGVSITSGMNSGLVNYRLNVLNDLTRVPVTGRVTNASGAGISKVSVNFTDQNGNSRSALTNGFGYFHFGDLPAGATYTISPVAKQYTFAPQTVTIIDAYDNLDFTAAP